MNEVKESLFSPERPVPAGCGGEGEIQTACSIKESLVLERAKSYMDWIQSRIKPDGWTASEKTTFHKSATFMDYLHGDVMDEEAWFACRYEYARESKDVWDAAKLRDDAQTERNLNCEQAFWSVHYEFADWIQSTYWLTDFFLCESFPRKDWNALTDAERKKILFLHETRKVPPLKLQILHYLHYPKEEFPEFNELAAQTKPVVKNVLPGEPQEPVKVTEAMVKKSGSVYDCLFMVDFSESAKPLSQRFVEWLKLPKINALRETHRKPISKTGKPFRAKNIVQWHTSTHWCLFEVDLSANKTELAKHFKNWLASPENKKRLKRHCLNKRGKTGEWNDRLKDLAAWRLYRENVNSYDKANEFANRNRKKFKTWPEIYAACKKVNGKWPYKPNDPRPFRDAKLIKGKSSTAANGANLFFYDYDYRHAKVEVIKFLSDWIPSEFKRPFPELMKAWEKLDKISSRKRQ